MDLTLHMASKSIEAGVTDHSVLRLLHVQVHGAWVLGIPTPEKAQEQYTMYVS